jgi:hypothetical protein
VIIAKALLTEIKAASQFIDFSQLRYFFTLGTFDGGGTVEVEVEIISCLCCLKHLST